MTIRKQQHRHPKPWLKRLIEFGAFGTALVMLIGAVALSLLPLWGAPSGFVLAGFLLALLSLPVWMLTAYAPEVSVDESGITLHPAIWADRSIPWESITAVKVYPLLPTTDEEVVRRYVAGKRRYEPAKGIILLIPGLPIQYRIVGYFAGIGSQPSIALTNRAHADYEQLIQMVLNETDASIHDFDGG